MHAPDLFAKSCFLCRQLTDTGARTKKQANPIWECTERHAEMIAQALLSRRCNSCNNPESLAKIPHGDDAARGVTPAVHSPAHTTLCRARWALLAQAVALRALRVLHLAQFMLRTRLLM